MRSLLPRLLAVLCLTIPQLISAGPVPFGPGQHFGTDRLHPTDLYAADINRDGKMDILTTSRDDDTVSWYQNNGGAINTWPEREITTDPDGDGASEGVLDGVGAVTAVDIDRDGDLDVVASAQTAGKTLWFQSNNGLGTSWTQRTVSAIDGGGKITAGDINRDGWPDIAITTNSDIFLYIHDQNSPATFTRQTISTYQSFDVQFSDFDNDGDMDLLTLELRNIWARVIWYENDGAATPVFTERELTLADLPSNLDEVDVADINRDGALDLVISAGGSSTGGQVYWYQTTSLDPPTFIKNIVYEHATIRTEGAEVIDWDRDGDLDIAVIFFDDNSIAWFENTDGAGTSWTRYPIGSFDLSLPGDLVLADMDGDGDIDALGDSWLWDLNRFVLYSNETIHGRIKLHAAQILNSTLDDPAHFEVADYDHNGLPDVIAAYSGEGRPYWIRQSPLGTFSTFSVGPSLGCRAVAAADIRQDGGSLDIAAAAFDGDRFDWFPNSSRQQMGTNVDGPAHLDLGDINRDGWIDAVGAAENANSIIWYESSARTFSLPNLATEHVIDSSATGAVWVKLADIDRDGDLDIVAALKGLDDIVYYENNGAATPSFTKRTVTPSLANVSSLYPTDLDGDGWLDIVATTPTGNAVYWYENDGTPANGSWQGRLVLGGLSGAHDVRSVDFDFDGDMDLSVTAGGSGRLYTIENQGGNPPSWTWSYVSRATIPSAAFADLDLDGDIDFITGSTLLNSAYKENNEGGQYSFTTTSTAPGTIYNGYTDDVLKVVLNHEGRTGDSDVELTRLRIAIGGGAIFSGYTSAEANALIDNLYIYGDNGDDTFDAGTDTLYKNIGTLNLSNGVQNITFSDGAPNAQLSATNSRTYWVVVKTTGNASSQSPSTFKLQHVTEGSSTSLAEDAVYDIPLKLMYSQQIGTQAIFTAIAPTPTPSPTPSPTPTPTATATPTMTPLPTQAPFGTPIPIPGRIEVEKYDLGGEGVGYHDTTSGNSGNEFRMEDVDIQFADDNDGEYNVGWTAADEWMEYTVNVAASTDYVFRFRVASPSTGGTFHLELNESDISGPISFLATNDWQSYTTIQTGNIALSSGTHELRFVSDTAGYNINWIEVATPTPCPLDRLGTTDDDRDGFVARVENQFGTSDSNPNQFPPIGDINGDGVTNLLDAMILSRQLNWPQAPTDCLYDMNTDGSINATDKDVLYHWSIGDRNYYYLPD